MMRTLLIISAVLALAGHLHAASSYGGDINQLLVSKLEAMEQKLTSYQQVNYELAAKLSEYQQSNGELASKLAQVTTAQDNLHSELEIEQKSRRVIEELLEKKLQSTTDEYSSIKGQLIKLFSSLSSAKQDRLSNDDKEAEESNPDQESIKDVDEDNPITATLEITGTGGVSYIRWGRSVCEGDADVLYTGSAAGKFIHSAYPLTGSDIICLHGSPEWGIITSSWRQAAPVAGVEYMFYDDDPFSKENVGGGSLKYHDMPCTVCHVDTRSHQLMIPGRKSCPKGWTMEYWGYLVTSTYQIQGGAYQCLDQAPEGAPNGSANQTYSQHVNAAEAYCGSSLPCPPYFHGFEISCVICSK